MVNPRASELSFIQTTPPPRGTSLEVAPGIKWVRMGLPFALDHINLWLLRDAHDDGSGQGVRQGWTLVDCGIDNADTRSAWEQVFANELEGLPIVRVVATHMHPDHIGLAHWLSERWAARWWISLGDFNAARLAVMPHMDIGGEPAAAFARMHGVSDGDLLDKLGARGNYFSSLVPRVPTVYRRLMDGMTLDIGGHRWRCIAGYGHAPEHMALHCESLGVLISGDMVLPNISTNVMVYHLEPESNPLQLFLDSLLRYLELPASTLALPSHGLPFKGMHERVRQLHDHHDERLAQVLAACTEAPCSAADVLPLLFRRKLDVHQTTFAMGEAVAHLHALWHRGLLRVQVGGDGVRRFASVKAEARQGRAT